MEYLPRTLSVPTYLLMEAEEGTYVLPMTPIRQIAVQSDL